MSDQKIEQVDHLLRDWIGSILTETEVSLDPPTDGKEGCGISLYLVELIHTPPARSARRPPLQISLRYLVTAWAEKPEEAHHLLGALVFAALENPEFEVELDPVPIAIWTALGVAPRPSFVLRVPLRVERPEPVAPLVRLPLVLKGSPLESLHGLVLGPGDIPIMGAQVELPALQLSTRTDAQGRFHFSAVPAAPRVKLLRVRAKGREFSVNLEQAVGDGEPLIIHLPGMEE